MHACMHACMHTYARAHTHARTHPHARTDARTRAHTSGSYMHYLKYLGNTAGRITFDSIWSKPTKEKPIPSTVVHVIFTVASPA